MKTIFLSLFLMISSLSYSALSPLSQSAVEIETILRDPQLHKHLSEPINEIYRTEEGYLVCTDHYFLQVDVYYLPSEGLGPAHFELGFHSPREYLP